MTLNVIFYSYLEPRASLDANSYSDYFRLNVLGKIRFIRAR
ncbi:uncharacterized protein METZ01_LOCUS482445 [marine metagenome]|uniref:Uncharacterized protein n=1 Tax=marine metagenome TaxID=408172 RepID=A0A383CBP9_9ZZZZ